MSAAILVLELHGENFFQVEKFKISNFQAVHCVIKNAISPKVFNRFSKTFTGRKIGFASNLLHVNLMQIPNLHIVCPRLF